MGNPSLRLSEVLYTMVHSAFIVCSVMENSNRLKRVKYIMDKQAQWLSGRVLDSRPRGCRFDTHQGQCVVSLSKTH